VIAKVYRGRALLVLCGKEEGNNILQNVTVPCRAVLCAKSVPIHEAVGTKFCPFPA
jgi:hypothetical protein